MVLKESIERRRKELGAQLASAFENLETAKARVAALQGAVALCDEFLVLSADAPSDGKSDGNKAKEVTRV